MLITQQKDNIYNKIDELYKIFYETDNPIDLDINPNDTEIFVNNIINIISEMLKKDPIVILKLLEDSVKNNNTFFSNLYFYIFISKMLQILNNGVDSNIKKYIENAEKILKEIKNDKTKYNIRFISQILRNLRENPQFKELNLNNFKSLMKKIKDKQINNSNDLEFKESAIICLLFLKNKPQLFKKIVFKEYDNFKNNYVDYLFFCACVLDFNFLIELLNNKEFFNNQKLSYPEKMIIIGVLSNYCASMPPFFKFILYLSIYSIFKNKKYKNLTTFLENNPLQLKIKLYLSSIYGLLIVFGFAKEVKSSKITGQMTRPVYLFGNTYLHKLFKEIVETYKDSLKIIINIYFFLCYNNVYRIMSFLKKEIKDIFIDDDSHKNFLELLEKIENIANYVKNNKIKPKKYLGNNIKYEEFKDYLIIKIKGDENFLYHIVNGKIKLGKVDII